jgi:hypothetical protein
LNPNFLVDALGNAFTEVVAQNILSILASGGRDFATDTKTIIF